MQQLHLPLLAGPQRPLGMILVLAAGVGVHEQSKLSGELVAILLCHERHHQLIIVHRNENAPFSYIQVRLKRGKWDGQGGRRWGGGGGGGCTGGEWTTIQSFI
jgi:hypothetical protein